MLARDKVLHFLFGGAISAVVTAVSLSTGHGLWTGFLIAALIGVFKEVYDRSGRGQVELLDFLWTGFGGAVPPILLWSGVLVV